jgi:Putative auto-transporter adhesin, head GIN domain
MIKFIITLTTIVVSLFFTSCKSNIDFDNAIDGNGNVKTETRTINQPFTKISVSRGIEVVLEQNETVFVEVETDENLLKHITTTVENGTLIVTSDENIDESEARLVRIKMPTIESLETTSGSSLKTKNTIRGINLSAKSSSGSELTATVEYEKVHAESTSGSDLTLTGKALKLESASSSGSQINADKLLVNEVNAQATSGSSTDVHALVKIDGKASSGASVNFDGKPKTVKKEESSGGSVSGN